jgi:hypothetical protein
MITVDALPQRYHDRKTPSPESTMNSLPTSRLAPVLTPLAAGIACLAIPDAAAGPRQANPGRTTPAQAPDSLQPFLGKPLFLPIAQLWRGKGGTSIVTTPNGTVVAFQSMAGNTVRRSTDGANT